MSATYDVVIRKPLGNFIASACQRDFLVLDYTLKLNAVGAMSIVLPADRYPDDLFDQDNRIEIWRKPRGGINYLEAETCWFVNRIESTRATTTLIAETANALLKRRLVTYQDTISEANVKKLNMPLDDMLKEIVSENTGIATTGSYTIPAPDTQRFLTPYLSIEADAGLWLPTTDRRVTHDILFDVAVANVEKQNGRVPGDFYFFDIVQIANDGVTNPFLELRTYELVRGTDRRGFVTVSEDEQTLTNARLIRDWSQSYNRIYAGGPGEAAARIFALAQDPTLAATLLTNPFALREKFYDGRKAKDLTETQASADKEYDKEENHPFKQLDGTLTESACNQYGRTFFFGDRISAYHVGQTFSVFVNPVHVRVEGGKEVFDVKVTEKVATAADGLTALIRKVNQTAQRLRELETIDVQ